MILDVQRTYVLVFKHNVSPVIVDVTDREKYLAVYFHLGMNESPFTRSI